MQTLKSSPSSCSFSFSVSPSPQDFGRTSLSLLAKVFSQIIKELCNQDLTHSFDKLKSLSVKSVPQVVIRDACGT